MKRTLCILLSIMLAVTGFAGLCVPAAAAETGKTIEIVTNGKADYITGAQTSSVWFGNYMQSSADSKEPVKWRVLSNADGKLFLLNRRRRQQLKEAYFAFQMDALQAENARK